MLGTCDNALHHDANFFTDATDLLPPPALDRVKVIIPPPQYSLLRLIHSKSTNKARWDYIFELYRSN